MIRHNHNVGTAIWQHGTHVLYAKLCPSCVALATFRFYIFNYLVDLCRLDSGVKKWDEKLETTVIIRGGGRRELCGGTGWENGFAGDREANMSGIAVERVYGVEWQVCIASFVCG